MLQAQQRYPAETGALRAVAECLEKPDLSPAVQGLECKGTRDGDAIFCAGGRKARWRDVCAVPEIVNTV